MDLIRRLSENHSNIVCPIIVAVLLIICSTNALAERLTIKVPLANIRSGPGTKYDIIWNVEKYHPVVVLEKSGPWYHFCDFEGDKGWIHKSLVDEISSVITNKVKCNIRSGPGTKYDILFTVEEGIPFKVIKSKGNWIYIQHADGDRGWIHKSLIW
ncbi:MAG: SH3 domain-containing protein [Thermodesulfobacteriota bacterium]|nr:SH3 domain-containing protein [Thermodesulfobacteriota bacterium]